MRAHAAEYDGKNVTFTGHFLACSDSHSRPCAHAQDPRKLTRYRDNHVVNTKGERFTVPTKRDQEGEDMKKTYINLKPLKKYRFH